ncbi:MAG: AI-2E family transporter [Betaproteobacteria bacterium]
MNIPPPASPRYLESKAFLWLLVLVTVAFVYILLPFYGAVLWGTAMALVFAPLHRHFVSFTGGRRTLAALVTVFFILCLVILPLMLVAALLVQEVAGVYRSLESGDISVARYIQQFLDALPTWVTSLLGRFGLDQQWAVQEKLTGALTKYSKETASHALGLGRDTFELAVEFFVMLYLLFFLLRDGPELGARISKAIPLREEHKRSLAAKFTTILRATVKGNLVVAGVQGALGGLIFWFLGIHAPVLWGVLMAFLSLLPAIGAGIVWVPVAAYLLISGSPGQGAILVAYGVLVIGLVDNLLRPVLVGKDTRMPDYVVLLATLGGMTIFGINGFVIGPLVAGMFIAVWHILAAERTRHDGEAGRRAPDRRG